MFKEIKTTNQKIKLIIWSILIFILGLLCSYLIISLINNNSLSSLPKPEITGGERGMLGIDKNINEETIDKYLGRSDSVYRDMRMLKDPGNYEAIGGDSYLSGTIKGFEVVPYPYLTKVEGLPEVVGESYTGPTLFTHNSDKYIFLMCGGGGYAGMTKNLLVSLGWNADKIYDIGGYWYYNGENNITIKKTINGETSYDFWKLTYHDIDFNTLTKA